MPFSEKSAANWGVNRMMKKSRVFAAGLAVSVLGLPGSAVAAPTYTVTIGGFTGGGTLAITLAGTDSNNDGQLEWVSGNMGNASELTQLSAAFSGSSTVADFSFSYTLAQLQGSSAGYGGIFYTPGQSFSASGNGFGLQSGTFAVQGGKLIYNSCGTGTCYMVQNGSQSATSTDLGAASEAGGSSAVPEPATWAMMIGGFGMIGAAMRGSRARLRRGATA